MPAAISGGQHKSSANNFFVGQLSYDIQQKVKSCSAVRWIRKLADKKLFGLLPTQSYYSQQAMAFH